MGNACEKDPPGEGASLRWLRLTHRFAGMLVKLGLLGIASLLLSLPFYVFGDLGLEVSSSISFFFAAAGVGLLGFSAATSPFLLASWFLVSFFCYAQYSLKALLGVVLLVGVGMALLFSERNALNYLGVLLFILLFIAIVSHIILKFDPLFQPPAKQESETAKQNGI